MKKLTLFLSLMLALVGLKANAAMYIVGNNPFGNWHTYTGAEMTDNGNGVYTYVTDQISGTVWFVFADNLTTGTSDDWNTFNGNYRYGPLNAGQAITAGTEYTTQKSTNGNVSYSFAGAAGQSYQFTFDTNTMKFKVEGYVPPVEVNTYSVAGDPASVFGASWDEKATATEMTLENGLYTWTKEGVELTSGTRIAFKIVGNHDWGYAWPADNYTYDISESGTYDLVFTFNADTEEVGFTANKVQDGPEVNPLTGKLFILGQVNGNNWNPSTGIEMATADEDIFTLTDATISDSGDGYGFFSFTSKLGENADDWSFNDYRRGAMEDGLEVVDGVSAGLSDWGTSYAFKALPGTYDIEVGLSDGYVKLVKKGEIVPVIDDVYIIGDVNNIGWSATQGVPMTYNEGIYTAEITTQNQGDLGVAYFGFTKKLADVESETPWDDIAAFRFGPVSEDAFVMTQELLGVDCALATDGSYNSIALPAGTWTVTVDLANNLFTINGEWPDTPTPEPYTGNVYVLGEVNDNGGWFPNIGAQMTRDAENNVYTLEITTAGENVAEGEEIGYSYFSFTKQLAENDYENGGWEEIAGYRFGAVTDGNPFLVTDEMLDTELSLVNATEPMAFKIPAGTWDLTLSVDNMTLIINKVEPTHLRGDTDMDGIVGIADVTTLIDYILSKDAADIDMIAADCDEDGQVGIADATALIDYILNKGW